MPTDLTLRPITPADEEFLYRLYASTRAEELSALPWSAEQKAAFLYMQFAAQHAHYQEHYPGAQFALIMRGLAPMGRLYVARWDKEIRLMDIALLPAYRKQGIGTAFIKAILAEGQARGVPVTIHVEQFNPALRLYERLGFRRIEDKGVYYLMAWQPTM